VAVRELGYIFLPSQQLVFVNTLAYMFSLRNLFIIIRRLFSEAPACGVP
jgi:hypothetical protein